jgi:transposase
VDTWSPLWSSIVDSSLWEEPDCVVKIFLTMLALKDRDHVYRGTAYKLAKRSNKDELEVLEALKVLSSPDSRRQEHQEFDGRRIKAVEDGWLILNGEKYRSKVREEMTRLRNARSQKSFREREKMKNGNPLPGERYYCETGEELHEHQ